jgi:hypothetical protein
MPSVGNSSPFEVGPFAWSPGALPLTPLVDGHALRRAGYTIVLTWVPLAVLAILQGVALRSSDPRQSLLLDFAAYGRYFVAPPVLVYAATAVLPRLTRVVQQFIDADLITEADRGRFEALVVSTRGLLRSRWTDMIIIGLALIGTLVRSGSMYPAGLASWVRPDDQGTHLSLAGWWRMLVSQPLLNALLLTWFWRLLLWVRFIIAVARMDLQLVAAHPDLLGGLRFTLLPLRGFAFLGLAIGAMSAGSVANSVIIDGQPLGSFRYLIGAQVVGVLALLVGPAMLWMLPLIRLQAIGTLEYGRLATRMGHAFQQRWLKERRTFGDEALELQDFSAMNDLFAVVANVRAINYLVLDVKPVATIAVATMLPYIPILFAVMPVDEILGFALKVLG